MPVSFTLRLGQVLDRFYDLCEESTGDIQRYNVGKGKIYMFNDLTQEFEDGHTELTVDEVRPTKNGWYIVQHIDSNIILDKDGIFSNYPEDIIELVKKAENI